MKSIFEKSSGLAGVLLVAISCVSGISSAYAEDVGKGVLIVRGDAYGASANDANNYQAEDTDINGRLEQVSVLCARAANQTAAALVATDHTRVWGGYMSGKTTQVIQAGGHVVKDPQVGNPNHCLINGVKLSEITGMWH